MAVPGRSAAVQIARPPTQPKIEVNVPDTKKRDGTQRMCRNVLIYGACRFQDQGCVYYHPPPGVDPTTEPFVPSSPAPTSSKLSPVKEAKAPASIRGLGAEHLSAPVFIPKTPYAEGSPRTNTSTPLPVEQQGGWPTLSSSGGLVGAGNDSAMGYDESMLSMEPSMMESNMYMQHQIRQPLDYHLYTAPLPHIANPPLQTHQLHSFFIPDDLRRMINFRQEATYAGPSGPTGLPSEVGVYHSLVHLGNPASMPSRVWGHPAPVYRATSSVDGNVYCLRRLEGFKLVNEAAFGAIDTWRRMRHPNIVGMREAFTTKAFNDNSMILVYDFHPESTTVWEEHLSPEPPANPIYMRRQKLGMPIPERLLWSYITQITNALKAMHSSGLAARNMDPSKVLITGKHRIRLNGCGILDVLGYDAATPVAVYQQEDLVSFGKLVISLACEFFQPGQHPAAPLDHITRHYSPDVKNLVLFLISKPTPAKTIDDAVRMLSMRMLNELDAMQNYVDVLESELQAEVENGRLVRLLTKLGFINERAEFEMDPRWSDTGDRYILKLFRDYVFHSIGVDGSPILDLSHVLTCLNKLDAGLDERIMLVSRDDQSCLVVSYREIKTCVEAAFGDLRNAGGRLR